MAHVLIVYDLQVGVGAELEKKINDEFQQLVASGNPDAELAKLSSVGKKWELMQKLKEAEEQKQRQAARSKDVNKIDDDVRRHLFNSLADLSVPL